MWLLGVPSQKELHHFILLLRVDIFMLLMNSLRGELILMPGHGVLVDVSISLLPHYSFFLFCSYDTELNLSLLYSVPRLCVEIKAHEISIDQMDVLLSFFLEYEL